MEPDPLTDPRCMPTAETLLIDGANGICREVRLGPDPPFSLALIAVLLSASIAAVVFHARRIPSRLRFVGLLTVALIASGPGFHALFTLRADRPSAVVETAARIRRLHDRIRAFALRHGGVRVTVDECTECMPIVRLALAGLPTESGPASIELFRGAIGGSCRERERTLSCGALP